MEKEVSDFLEDIYGGYESDRAFMIDLYKMFDVSKAVVAPLMIPPFSGLDDISIVSGMSGVFSAFKVHVLKAADTFGVDARDIFMELGKQKVVAGQEDKIIEIAEKIRREK